VPSISRTVPKGVTIEKLGTEVVKGLLAEGTRTSGTVVVETWESLELKIHLLMSSRLDDGTAALKLIAVNIAPDYRK
jgi:hypothetical protein